MFANAILTWCNFFPRKYSTCTVVSRDVLCLVVDLNELSAVEIEPLPHAVLQSFCAQFEKSESRAPVPPEADLSHVDQHLTRSLMPFQRDGVK